MDFFVSNLIPILFVVVVLFLFMRRKQGQKQAGLRQQANESTRVAAEAIGLQVTQAPGGSVRGGQVFGDTAYQGSTGGVDWTLTSSLKSGSKNRTVRKSLWKTPAGAWPSGKYLLIISTSGEFKTGDIKRGGFFNNLVNMAADAMLDVYVGGYFGSEYKSLVNIGEDGVKLQREALKDFVILTNWQGTAEKFLDEPTVGVLSNWKKATQGFSRENLVDSFGVLFTPDGTLLACQADMTNAEEVKMFSDLGAALAVKMKGCLG